MQVAINPETGVIAWLSYVEAGDHVTVPFRSDKLAGPTWTGVHLTPIKPGEPFFTGTRDGVI